MDQEAIVCSGCNTMNDPGWSFCQQCGSRLTQAPPAPPPPQPPAAYAAPPALRTVAEQQVVDPFVQALRTNPEQHAVVDPFLQAQRTNPEPQAAEHGFKTVVAQPPPFEPSLRTVADRPSPAEPKAVQQQHPLPAAPPTYVPQPPPPPRIPDESTMRNSPVEAPVQPKPTAPSPPPPPAELKPTAPTPPLPVQEKPVALTPPIPKPSIPAPPIMAPPSAPEPTSIYGQAMSGPLCSQCGQSNTSGSAFCASCGAPVTFGQTMVISSQTATPPPPKGRLHLVMEGGQAGEVYELEGDTVIGRSNGEITFAHDGFMSGRHARIERRGGSFILTDEGSRNGTFLKITGEVELKTGDMILVGKQLFRFET